MEKFYYSKVNTPKRKQVVVLFTGGRDSSLVVSLYANKMQFVHLITSNNGTVINSKISNYRYKELRERFGSHIVNRAIIPSHGLFRRVALANIESDFKKYHKNLILLGDQLSIHTHAILYCIANGIKELASGFVSYEKEFAEQNLTAISLLKAFVNEYGINYYTPIYNYKSIDEVKYRLLDFGISTKSLEGFSIFADSFSVPSEKVVGMYIKEKLSICKEYIDFKLSK
jgi:hypothetical protein